MNYINSFNLESKPLNLWRIITPGIRDLLLIGSVGSNNLTGAFTKIAEEIPKLAHPISDVVFNMSIKMILGTWEFDPLNQNVLKIISSVKAFWDYLPPSKKDLLKAIHDFWNTPMPCGVADIKDVQHILSNFPTDSPPFSLNWLRHIRALVSIYKLWSWFDELLKQVNFPQSLEFIRQRLLLDSAIFQGDLERARKMISSRGDVFSYAFTKYFLGNISFLQRHSEEALTNWLHYIKIHPWDVNTILRIHDVLVGANRVSKPPPGRVSICLYSYNKRDAIDVTLDSIAKSSIPNGIVFVLINGSTDGSYEIVKGWQDRFGKDRFHIISLPINIGAPAARNWLMHHPEVKRSEWILFLDDDAIVPPDWLGRLGTAVELYPNGGAYGCKVVDSETPYLMQSVDYHLVRISNNDSSKEIPPYRWTTIHYELEDFGEFDYIRPCVHVTGCCHLFSRDVLLSCGDFDLRYSPSQFDDLDHDFRMALMDRPAIYNGFLTVYHMNNTARLHRRDLRARRLGDANWYKLMNRFAGKPFREIYRWERALLWEDFLKKLRVVQEALEEKRSKKDED
ncbi:MAG: glycosyltransferase family 2 protein [Syntrophobacterales bacterium]|nr:glycosyltransferase family 2 protein [Syntrophobacterales bacterium]